MHGTSSEVASAKTTILWYCTHCTLMIHPPGSPGAVLNEGRHYCANCAPQFEPRVMGTLASRAGRLETRGLAGQRSNTPWLAAGFMLAVLLLAGLAFFNHPRETPKVAASAGNTAGQSASPAGGEALSQASPQEPAAPEEPESPSHILTSLPLPAPVPPISQSARVAQSNTNLLLSLADDLHNAEQLSAASRYTDAGKLLDGLKGKYGAAPWWEQEQARVSEAQTALKQRLESFNEEAEETLRMILKSDKPEFLNATEAAWKPKLSLDESSSKPAQNVMAAIEKARARLIREASERKVVGITEPFEKYEKLVAQHPGKVALEPGVKFLGDLEKRMLADPALAEQFVERWAALRFDIAAASGGELGFYSGQVKTAGSGVELNYDFSSPGQLNGWSYERSGEETFRAEVNSKTRAVVLKAFGDQRLNQTHRVPFIRIPFLFNRDTWFFEANAALLKSRDHPQQADLNANYGILIWDGGGGLIRVGARRSKPGEFFLFANGINNIWLTSTLQGKADEKVRLRVNCQNGMLNFGAMLGGRIAPLGKAVKLPIDPRYLGLYVETRDAEEEAAIAFDNVTLVAVPDKAKLKDALSGIRVAQITAARVEIAKQAAALKLARDEATGAAIVKDWDKVWTVTSGASLGSPRKGGHLGRNDVWQTHPLSPDLPGKWTRHLKLDPAKPNCLRLDVASYTPQNDWVLVVVINGEELLNQVICTTKWEPIEVDLAKFAGQEVNIEMQNKAGGKEPYNCEFGYWDNVRVVPKDAVTGK